MFTRKLNGPLQSQATRDLKPGVQFCRIPDFSNDRIELLLVVVRAVGDVIGQRIRLPGSRLNAIAVPSPLADPTQGDGAAAFVHKPI